MADRLPTRIYRCPECGYGTEYRWVLKNHLYNVHGYGKRDSARLAVESEYWLNPHYIRARDLGIEEDSSD
jgi:hypothetical protein